MKKLVFILVGLLVFGLSSCVPEGKEKIGNNYYLDTIRTKTNHEIIILRAVGSGVVGCYESMSCPACIGLRETTETDATEY